MIPLNFYRDDNYVYYNNPNGITKKMTIADFEAMMSGEGGSDIPEHTSSNQGEVLSVDANGDLVWKTLPPSGGNTSLVLCVFYAGESATIQVGDSFSYFDVVFKDTESWEEVDLATLDFDYCIPLTFELLQGVNLVNFCMPDNDAYLSFGLTVRNASNGALSVSTDTTIAYIKLINPRPISTPSEAIE